MSMYIDMLLSEINRIRRKGTKEYNVFPIEAVNTFESIIKNSPSKKIKKNNNLYPSEEIPIFLPADRLIFLIFHLNCKFNISLNTKLKYNNTKRDSVYVKYIHLFSDNMSNYNYIDIFLELLKTISTKIYYIKLLYFALTLFKCLDTLVYLALRFIDDIIYNNKLNDDITKLLKKEKNKSFKILCTNMKKISTNNNGGTFKTRYEEFYKEYYCDSIPESLNVCIILYHFMVKDNPELKDKINRYNNTARDNLKSKKYIVDKYDDILNILLFYYVTTNSNNDYEIRKEEVIKTYSEDNIIYLLKGFIDNYLFLQNNMIENLILNSGKDNDVFFKDPFSVIYNHNFYFKSTFASYLWSTTVLFNDRGIFNRIYAPVDSPYKYSQNPDKELSTQYNTSNALDFSSFFSFSQQMVYNFDIYKHKYNRLIPYLYLNFTNKYIKKKGVGFQVSRLPYIKSSFSTSRAANLKKTILGSWNIIPYRYNTLTTKDDDITKKIFNNPVYASMSFISTCNDVWAYTSKKKIKGSSSAKGKFTRPPSYCNQMHIFSYNGDADINKDTFKKESRKFSRIFLKKTFVDIFKVNIMKEDLYGKSTTSFLNTLFYYDVSINLNIGENSTSAPLFFKNIKRVYKKKNQQDLREACLCKGFDKYDYLKFFKIEGGVIYLYENFYKLLLETFSLETKKSSKVKNPINNTGTMTEENKKIKNKKAREENKKIKNKKAREENTANQNNIIQSVHKLYNDNKNGGDNSKTTTPTTKNNNGHNNKNINNENNNNENNNNENNSNECSDKIRSLSVNTENDYFNNNMLPFMYMKYDGKKKKLTINYHPRHTQENIATITEEKDPDEKEYGDKKRLNVIINPDIGQYTMNYFIIMIIANLFWYCISYKLSSSSFKKMFNVSNKKMDEFDKSSSVFSKFDKIRLIDSKMNRILDYIFKHINLE